LEATVPREAEAAAPEVDEGAVVDVAKGVGVGPVGLVVR
jgi:hypothetical protein